MAADSYCITCGENLGRAYDPPIECDGCAVYNQAFEDGYKQALSQLKKLVIEQLATIPYDSRTKRGRRRTGLEATLTLINKLENPKPKKEIEPKLTPSQLAKQKREEAMNELTRLTEEMGLYDNEFR